MTFGKASRNVPPKATSQTSCQLHSGPMAATISRRSVLVRPATQCSTPAPMSQPSSTTNTISVTHSSANHTSTMRASRHGVRTVLDFAPDEIQEQQAEHEIESRHADQREQHVAGTDDIAVAGLRAIQTVDQPWLPAQL